MTTTIRKHSVSLPMARLGAPSNLPRFQWQQPMATKPTPPNFGLTDDEARHGFTWGEDSILPYQVSEDYDRTRVEAELKCIVIDNGRLRAVVAPSLGGRLLELKDLATGRDLVFRNPVFQPANLAALNAWFSGGIEWNGLVPGHTPFTCAPVFAGIRETADGPILRLYEFDRVVEATWQIDLFMPKGEAQLFAHGRMVNPADAERLAYWWTNVAAPMDKGTRVLSPADYSVEHIWPGNNLGRCDFPRAPNDPSYPDNWENATSVFFRAPDAPRLFIASVDGDGYGLMQTGTRELAGRKFFYFGNAQGGQNWMDYLSNPGEGNYLEIQSGVAPTQNQRFALAPGEQREWTEVFMPIQLAADTAHASDYGTAVSHAADALDGMLSAAALAEMHDFLSAEARLPLTTRLSSGAAWGARQEQLLGRALAEGLDFSLERTPDFWDALAANEAIGTEHLKTLPDGIVVSDVWMNRLTESAAAHGMTWVHALMLAVAALDRGDRAEAQDQTRAALSLQPSWLGYRMQALLDADGDTDAAMENYLKAWGMGDAPPELAVEIAQFLMTADRPAELKRFVDALPADIRDNERIVLARAVVAADQGAFDTAEELLLSRQFATIREGETLLSDMWIRLRRGRLAAALGRTPTREEINADLSAHPMPKTLDLRMHALEDS
ncbi:DUF5107 domain-containing protein [Devosia sp.]|uniref:DUF5107 domain-containing protein n=1 Tax=Devosia sp. TaxID=1871048 RepID=UPI003A8F8192